MTRKLYSLEQKWLNLLLEASFRGKNVIEKQLSKAYVISDDINRQYASIKLGTRETVSYPYRERVPVTMLTHVEDARGKRPIAFLLHVVDGYIDELEIYDAAGFEILDYNKITFDNIEYQT